MLKAKPFSEVHWHAYQCWHEDQELSRRASFPDANWFAYVSALTTDGGIAAFEDANGNFVSIAQFDMVDAAMTLFVAVNPQLRKQGFGRQTIEALITSAPLIAMAIDGFIEHNYHASIAMVTSPGFDLQCHTPDKEGFLYWRFTL